MSKRSAPLHPPPSLNTNFPPSRTYFHGCQEPLTSQKFCLFSSLKKKDLKVKRARFFFLPILIVLHCFWNLILRSLTKNWSINKTSAEEKRKHVNGQPVDSIETTIFYLPSIFVGKHQWMFVLLQLGFIRTAGKFTPNIPEVYFTSLVSCTKTQFRHSSENCTTSKPVSLRAWCQTRDFLWLIIVPS